MIKIEITTIEDLISFVAIIRSPDADLQKIQELTNKLGTSTNALVEAEKSQEKTNG